MPLIDNDNRRLNYLRVSITDRCNLRCLYCAPDGMIPKLDHADILTYEEILRIIRIGAGLGITKVRVTGGEPLTRKGVTGFLKSLCAMPGLEDVTLTTNAVLLADLAGEIKKVGVKRLNISLDTLDPTRYREIMGFDHFDRVWKGIMSAHELGFSPIKINAVALKGYNEDELSDLASLSMTYPFHIRFIEYMPIGRTHGQAATHITASEIKAGIEHLGKLVPVHRDHNDGPAKRFRIENAKGEIGFISAMSRHFCDTCNRLRMTADGHLRPCLLSDRQIDIKDPLRGGADDRELAEMFCRAIRRKPSRHHLKDDLPPTVDDHMSGIGG